MRKFFEKYGKPTWYVDRLIYTFPLHMAAKFNTPMLCYGENVSFEYGGNADKETYSAMGQIENGVAVGMPMEELLGGWRDRERPLSDAGPQRRGARQARPVLHELLCALEQLQELPDRQGPRFPRPDPRVGPHPPRREL